MVQMRTETQKYVCDQAYGLKSRLTRRLKRAMRRVLIQGTGPVIHLDAAIPMH